MTPFSTVSVAPVPPMSPDVPRRDRLALYFDAVQTPSGPLAHPHSNDSAAACESPGSGTAAPCIYQPRVEAEPQHLAIRGLRYHLRTWRTGTQPTPAPVAGKTAMAGKTGEAAEAGESGREPPLLVLLHGWMDVSASFQFVVDALQGRWRVVAPDWRGFGLSEGSPGCAHAVDSYAFADYLGDLDALLAALSPKDPVRLVAHSMGGNVAMLYAGIRPARVAGLVNLEGFGMPPVEPGKAVDRYRRWLDELRAPVWLRSFASLEEVAARLIRTNPRLPMDKARYLAGQWSRLEKDDAGGAGAARYALLADPAHRRINPVLYRVDEAVACWRAITAPVLWVTSPGRDTFHQFTQTDEYRRRLTAIARLKEVELADAGHMLHHDQPTLLAGLIEEFFTS